MSSMHKAARGEDTVATLREMPPLHFQVHKHAHG